LLIVTYEESFVEYVKDSWTETEIKDFIRYVRKHGGFKFS